jgi:hypothetical protein
MIESRRRFPALEGMAFKAVLPHLSPMLILVAVKAGGIEPQKCPVKSLIRVQEFRIPLNMICFVAFSAIETSVLPLQPVTGFGMIKIIDTVRPPDQFVVAAQVLHMTGNAVFVTVVFMQSFSV